MNLFKINIKNSDLKMYTKNEQIFFIQLANFLNEINILQKTLIIINNNLNNLDKIHKRAQTSQSMFFLKILIGKLNEGWEFFRSSFFGTKLSKEYKNKFSQSGKNSLSSLKKHFSQKNMFNYIRKKYSFHYDNESIKKEISSRSKDEIFNIYLAQNPANCLYSFADSIVNWSILNYINSSDPQEAMDMLVGDTISACGSFQEVGLDLIKLFLEKLDLCWEKIIIEEPISYGELTLPYFIKKN